ncbi:MAG: SDR family oxidoreductase [Pseudomonadales bacterium]|nr:SDR family oxidoreductase [Pseudomonadales bacterium]
MNLDIAGRRAVVCGGSSGLGLAIAEALANEGVDVTLVARDPGRLSDCAAELAARTGRRVLGAAVDLANPQERARLHPICAESDILINNSGGPPVGDYLSFTRDDWLSAIEANMLSAIELINVSLPGMKQRGFGRIVNVTSHMVKAPVALLSLSNGARAGLTGFVGGVARDVARFNVTINNLLPGQFATPRLEANHHRFAKSRGETVEAFQAQAMRDVPARRFGRPEEFGAFAAFLCGACSGFVTGQNLLIDGGQYPGLI